MSRKVVARFLASTEYPEWNRLVSSSPEGSIYSTTEYLDVLCSVTDARFRVLAAEKGGEIVGGIALYERRGLWGRYAAPRLLLYYNGPVIGLHDSKYPSEQSSRRTEILAALAEELEGAGYGRMVFRNLSSLQDVRTFIARGWRTWVSYTYVVPVSDLEAQWMLVEQNLRRLIQRCRREGVQLSEDGDFESFFRMHQGTHDRKKVSLYLPRAAFSRYFQRLKSQNLCRLYHARLPDGRSVSAQLVLLGPHPLTHTVCAGADPGFLRTGATAFLRWSVFEELSRMGYAANDLTDAALNPVSHFKSQFGGDLEPCFNLRGPESVMFRLQGMAAEAARCGRSAVGALARRVGLRRGGRK